MELSLDEEECDSMASEDLYYRRRNVKSWLLIDGGIPFGNGNSDRTDSVVFSLFERYDFSIMNLPSLYF